MSGNCGTIILPGGHSWQCDQIESVGSTTSVGDVAVVQDGEGYPMIAYRDTSSGDRELKLARPAAALPGYPGNSGLGSPVGPWYCSSLVSRSTLGSSVADAVDLAVLPSGRAVLLYYAFAALDSGTLWAGYEGGWPLFSDGFELGDTSRWEVAAP